MAEYCVLICEFCSGIFKNSSNLSRHIKSVHFSERKFMCEYCSKNYNNKSNLNRHIANNHSDNAKKKPVVNWQCPICVFKSSKQIMVEHYRLTHNIDTSSTTIQCDSFAEFLNWKQNIENESSSKYIRYRIKKYSSSLRYFYRCHRDGLYKAAGKNIRHIKKTGSNKINAHCPARIDVSVSKDTGSVCIKYTKSHVGHKTELISTNKYKNKSMQFPVNNEIMEVNVGPPETNLHTELEIDPVKQENEIMTDIEVVKKSLLEKFQLILGNISSLEECDIVNEELVNIKNNLLHD